MHIVTARVPWDTRLARFPDLSMMARQSVKWMDYYLDHGQNASLACRYFEISRQTFYRWKKAVRSEGFDHLGGALPPTEAVTAAYLVA